MASIILGFILFFKVLFLSLAGPISTKEILNHVYEVSPCLDFSKLYLI